MHVRITGSFRNKNLKVGTVRFGKKGPEELKEIIHRLAPHNYHQIPGWIVAGVGRDDCTLLLQKTTQRGIEEKEVVDFQAMYSVHNFGYSRRGPHGRILTDVLHYLHDARAPKALPRSLDHAYHAAAITAITKFTKLDRVIMKSGGAEAVETACNIASRFYHTVHRGKPHKEPLFIVPRGNFHGRTLRARSFSTDPKARDGFEPLPGNVHYVQYGDLNDLEAALSLFEDRCIAFVVEPVRNN